jgi:hypothetical protein
MRILVTGSRDWWDWNTVNRALFDACAGNGDIVIVHGACPTGADMWADRFVEYQGVQVERHPANWRDLGKRAGYVRNEHMVNLGADIVLAFIRNGSRGATHTADLAESRGLTVRRYVA